MRCSAHLRSPGGRLLERCLSRGQRERLLNHSFVACLMRAAAGLDRLTHAGYGVVNQKLQYFHVAACTGYGSMIILKLGSERGEACRKLPSSIHRRMIKRAWFTV